LRRMDRQTMWVDVDRCTGCGACVEVCPTGAMTLIGDAARVDEERCTGCGACADVCPVGAIRPVLHGEIVPSYRQPPAAYRPGPLMETAGAAATVAGVGLLMRVARALPRVVGRWLTRRSELGRPYGGASSSVGRWPGAGRRRRRRRRRGG